MPNKPVVGVLSGCGGAGASTFAAVLAGSLAVHCRLTTPVVDPAVFLLDCDPLAGGIDVLLGCEEQPGPRWGQVHLRGGELDPDLLRQDLPRWDDVSFLAAATPEPLPPETALQVIDAAQAGGAVVLDLPRWPGDLRRALVDRCDLLVVVTAAEIRAVTSTAFVVGSLGRPDDAVVTVVRGSSRALPVGRIAAALGVEVIGELPHDGAVLGVSGLRLDRVRRATRRVADAVIDRAIEQRAAA